jgi:hypothetical protein
VVKAFDMGGSVEYPVANGKGTIYGNNEGKEDVAVVDTHTFKIKARWPLAPAGGPVAIAMDRDDRRLFSSARNLPNFKGNLIRPVMRADQIPSFEED